MQEQWPPQLTFYDRPGDWLPLFSNERKICSSGEGPLHCRTRCMSPPPLLTKSDLTPPFIFLELPKRKEEKKCMSVPFLFFKCSRLPLREPPLRRRFQPDEPAVFCSVRLLTTDRFFSPPLLRSSFSHLSGFWLADRFPSCWRSCDQSESAVPPATLR